MASLKLSQALRQEYESLFNSCSILSAYQSAVNKNVELLLNNQQRYLAVGNELGIHWSFIAVIHNMEASVDFNCHLHNGDSLKRRTVQVPAGRPLKGSPPFAWEQSAEDALTMKGLNKATDWSLAGTLYQLERYNGWGYRTYHQHVFSPYLWSFSNHYSSGKYIADGTWSDTAKSKQCGAAVLLRRMVEMGLIDFIDQPPPRPNDAPLLVSFSTKKSPDKHIIKQAELLQTWLNSFPGIFLRVDGIPGRRTADAYKKVTGGSLPGDK